MSIFEIIMLVCFGLAWPFSIWRTYTSRKNHGKSLHFLVVVLIGYMSGVVHKLTHKCDAVTFLYALNGIMVSIDICLYVRNMKLAHTSHVDTVEDVLTE